MGGMWKRPQTLSSQGIHADKRDSCEASLVFTGSPACLRALNQPSSLHAHLFPVGSAGMCMTEKITSVARQGGPAHCLAGTNKRNIKRSKLNDTFNDLRERDGGRDRLRSPASQRAILKTIEAPEYVASPR